MTLKMLINSYMYKIKMADQINGQPFLFYLTIISNSSLIGIVNIP